MQWLVMVEKILSTISSKVVTTNLNVYLFDCVNSCVDSFVLDYVDLSVNPNTDFVANITVMK